MSVLWKKAKYLLLTCLCLFGLSSCENSKNRIDLTYSFKYLETPSFVSAKQVDKMTGWKTVPNQNRKTVNKLLTNEHNYLWFKLDFKIPAALTNQDLGLYIEELKTADRVYINTIPCGSYGRFPPSEMSAGFGAQHFSLPLSTLTQTRENTILIQTWTGCPFSLPSSVFVGTEFDAFQKAERRAFFTSRIILCFACISFIAFFIYLMLHFFLKNLTKSRTYLHYSFLMLFSVITLLPFCLYEIPWLKPEVLSYFTIMKILLTVGIYTTIYTVNRFMISFMEAKENKIVQILRIIFYLIPLIGTLTITEYEQIPRYNFVFFPIIFLQFLFTAYKVIPAFKNKKTRGRTILLFVSLIPAIVGFVIDACSNNYINIQITPPYASIYLWQLTSYIFIGYLLYNFAQMYIKNTKLKNSMVKFNASLENEVEIRTKELSEKNFILSRGLEAITLVQQQVLPKGNKTFMGWDISVMYVPLDNEVSGDFFDYYYDDCKLDGLSILDISGHGIQAGLMSVLAKGIINQKYNTGKHNNKTLSEILVDINNTYIIEKVDVENYFTALLFNFDDFDENDKCNVQLANAGHPAPLLFSAKDNSVDEVKYEKPEEQYGFIGVDGLPISFPTTEFSMEQEDILVCFTDGLTEAMNNDKEDFSKNRVSKIIKASSHLSAKEILTNILKGLDHFLDGNGLSDDLTLIVLKRVDSSEYLEEI